MSEVVTITAHYTLTKDGLVYGAITGADADVKHDLKPGESTLGVYGARITLAAALQKMVDVPFSFRAKEWKLQGAVEQHAQRMLRKAARVISVDPELDRYLP